ncbi:MAG TPA: ATP-binding cassette domain-containing protein [Actinomycetota bacterium]|nr:ATP-binding cassette domain-containing protein [Actinomycetota bacterium]
MRNGPEPLLAARGLRKTFHGGAEPVHALRGVSLEVAPEEVVAIVGPSGSGKTTLLMALLGWDTPDEGEVVWRGRALPHLGSLGWDEVAVAGQRLGLVEELTVEENVELPLTIAGVEPHERAERVTQALEALALDSIADRVPAATSLGEQQRTALARGLVRSPRLLLADEPTSHQDAERKRLLFRRLDDHRSLGGSCLVATHDPDTLAFCDRIVRMESGALDERAGTAS